MQPVKLSPLAQVEYAVKDLDYSMQFFAEVFGESEVENTFSRVLTNPALDIRHAGFGKTEQQFCQPLMEGLPHSTAVQEWGNCVHNLCFLVDNIDTRAVFGFQLELSETPWREEPEPPIMLPAYGPQWAAVGADSGNTLRGINVVVDSLEHTLHALQSVFAGSISLLQPSAPYDDDGGYFMVVELGLVPLVYIQPGSSAELSHLLKERGPAVHSLLVEVADVERAKQCLTKLAIKTSVPERVLLTALGDSEAPGGELLQVQSMKQIGVEFTLKGSK